MTEYYVNMSVVCENQLGWVLDHEHFWNKSYHVILNNVSSGKLNSEDAENFTSMCNYRNDVTSNSHVPRQGENFSLTQERPDSLTQEIPDSLTKEIPDTLTQEISDSLTQEIPDSLTQERPEASQQFAQVTHKISRSSPNSTKGDNYVIVSINPELFAIHQPFKMDSQFEKYASNVMKALESVKEGEKGFDYNNSQVAKSQPTKAEMRRRRKRKKKSDEIPEHVKELAEHLENAHKSLLKLAVCHGHFKEKSSLPLNNNVLARQSCKKDGEDMAMRVPIVDGKIAYPQRGSIQDHQHYSFPDLCHRLYCHEGEFPVVITCDQQPYVIPARARFYISHTDQLHSFISAIGRQKFDLIVLDPPWENKSVKRKKVYDTLPDCDMKDLPIVHLVNQDSLIAIWVTNNKTSQDYVREVLFPHWSVQYLTQWYWLKVTLGGEPVTDILSEGKKPYESVILGRYSSPDSDDTDQDVQDPTGRRVIVSIPCILHSKKPPLQEILKPYCIPNPACLELFARNLQPGWTSWGNEVLRHQNLKLYKSTKKMD